MKEIENQIPIKKVIFNNGSPNFIYSLENWNNNGKFKGSLIVVGFFLLLIIISKLKELGRRY